MTISALQHQFLTEELGLLSINAALATRNAGWPVYARSKTAHQRTDAKNAVRRVLKQVESHYSNGGSQAANHTTFIAGVAAQLSGELPEHFFQGRFRFGVAQKLVNLHLKYLWVAGLSPEPPHCPIDGIIRDRARIEYDWTVSDSQREYEEAIAQLRQRAGNMSLAEWELQEFERRRT